MDERPFALGTFSGTGSAPFVGLVIDNQILPLFESHGFEVTKEIALSSSTTLLDLISNWDVVFSMLGRLVIELGDNDVLQSKLISIEQLQTHAPHNPRQVFCSGANYKKHVVDIIMDRYRDSVGGNDLPEAEARERAVNIMEERARNGEPYIFSRIQSSYAGPFDDLVLPAFTTEPDWEVELAVVFKYEAQMVKQADAMKHVAGYMVVNDISNRDVTFRTDDMKALGTDWLQGKNSPGYFPMGPIFVPAEFVKDPHNLCLTLKLNGDVMQNETTADMIFDIPRQIEVLTKYVKIFPGDVLATGSPAGNGTHFNRYLKPGDVMETTVEGMGTQRTKCIASPNEIMVT